MPFRVDDVSKATEDRTKNTYRKKQMKLLSLNF